jgi:hypothetical protein
MAQSEENHIRENMVANVLATDSGKELFRFLFEVCGYEQPSVVLDGKTGQIDTEKMLYNEARRSVYIQLRALAPIEELKKIEYKERTEETK